MPEAPPVTTKTLSWKKEDIGAFVDDGSVRGGIDEGAGRQMPICVAGRPIAAGIAR